MGAPDSGGDSMKTDGGGHHDSGGGHDASDAGGDAPVDAFKPDKSPITGLKANTWTWVPIEGAECRDGSPTGIGVNLGTADKVMIFLEGGGACFNFETCLGNPSSFSETDLTGRASSTMDGYSINVGILDRTNAANPAKDWSYVYVPYCTGDIHAGNAVAPVTGYLMGAPQHFAGYVNMTLALDRVVPTFPKATEVLLAGMSAGGFGAALNYAHVAGAFGSVPVTLLDDSGPFMEDPYLATCLQDKTRMLWGLDKTVLKDCGASCSSPSSFFLDYIKHMAQAHPSVGFGLADSTDDGTITQFFGFGASSCTGYQQLSGATFTAGMEDIRTKLSAEKNFGEFLFVGTDHTTIQSAAFYPRTAGGPSDAGVDGGPAVLMTDWVTGLLAGKPTNPGP